MDNLNNVLLLIAVGLVNSTYFLLFVGQECPTDRPLATIDYGRELWDILRKNTWDKQQNRTFEDTLKDSNNDINADNYGYMQGILNPLGDCNNLLDEKYLENIK